MDMKSIFRRWKNGWRASTPNDSEPVVLISELSKANEWFNATRWGYKSSFDNTWNPFTKLLWIYDIQHETNVSRIGLYQTLSGDIGLRSEYARALSTLDSCLGVSIPDSNKIKLAGQFYLALDTAFKEPQWVELAKATYPNECVQFLINMWLKHQYGIDAGKMSYTRLAVLVWSLIGEPTFEDVQYVGTPTSVMEKEERLRYHVAIQKLKYMVTSWTDPTSARCCDYPMDLEPGDHLSLYKHTCRYKPYEEHSMPTRPLVTLINIKPSGSNTARWYVRTDKGDFPVTFGGEPDNMDLMIHPFYRFEAGPEHGMTSCVIRVASGTSGHYWYIRVLKSFEIYDIRDSDGDAMESIVLPENSPVLPLLRINCPLKDVL